MTSEPVVVYAAGNTSALAAADLLAGLRRHPLWLGLALFEIRQRFRRSMLGPLWVTLSTGVMIAALSLVFGSLFQQDIAQLVPHLATGLILWALISSSVLEGCTAFTSSEGFLRSVPMPTSVHVYRTVARNSIIFLFNMVIYLFVWILFIRHVSWEFLLVVPGLTILVLNLLWMCAVAAVVSTRYRDLPQVIASLVQIVFFITPIFWMVELLPSRPAFVLFNPFYHMIEIVRAPLLGKAPELLSWLIAGGILIPGLLLAFLLYRRAYPRIPYWV